MALRVFALYDVRLLAMSAAFDDNYIGTAGVAQSSLPNNKSVGKMTRRQHCRNLNGDDGIQNCGNAQTSMPSLSDGTAINPRDLRDEPRNADAIHRLSAGAKIDSKKKEMTESVI